MKFKLSLTGSKCNEYPRLTILHNQQIMYSGIIQENTTIEFDIDLQAINLITLEGINKSQGENGKCDTQLNKEGQIIADKWPLWNGQLAMRLYEQSVYKFMSSPKKYIPLVQK